MTGEIYRYLMLAIMLMACVLLLGCEKRDEPAPGIFGGGHASVGNAFVTLGDWLIAGGGLILTVASVGRILAFFPATAFLSAFGTIFAEAAFVGGFLCLLGASFLYLGLHSWLFAVVIGLLGLLALVRYRTPVMAFFRITCKVPAK